MSKDGGPAYPESWAGDIRFVTRVKCPECDGFGFAFGDPCAVCTGPASAYEAAVEQRRRNAYAREKMKRNALLAELEKGGGGE